MTRQHGRLANPAIPVALLLACGLAGTAPASAQEAPQKAATRPSLNFYGVTGLIDMPTGEGQPDGQFSATVAHFGGITRSTLSFQVFPRVSGSFRYAAFRNWDANGFDTFFDRSFDVSYRILDEGRYTPSVVIGLQDFAGTGISSGEYIVATRKVLPGLKLSAGLGWGRLGSQGSIGSPFGTRPDGFSGRGGKLESGKWFRGPVAPFGGIEWQATDALGFKVEYSSDAYTIERGIEGLRAGGAPLFDRRSNWSFGAEYQMTDSLRIGGYYLYGSEFGVSLQYSVDPRRRPVSSPLAGPGPLPVAPRPARTADPDAWSTEWVGQADAARLLRGNIARQLADDGILVEGLSVSADRARLRLRNTRFDAEAQAIGRAARVMSRTMPASVEVFEIVPVVDGMALSVVTLRRADIEELEHAPAGDRRLRERASISDAGALGAPDLGPEEGFPRFAWDLAPFIRTSFFDPDSPLRAEGGLRLSGRAEFAPGLMLSGSLAKPLAGNLDSSRRESNSVLPRVRTDERIYNREGDPAIENLALSWYSRPAENLYGRVTIGYLERMFGGVSGEVLWKPPDSRLGLGAELNYVTQRDFDQLFGFQTYDVVTGHVSAYYDLGAGYRAQLDAGRYLAGDIGATLTVEREFANGWRLSGFATLTDVSSEEFGEGSFDKGIRVEIPLTWVTGRPSRNSYTTTLRPVLRDGGARLNVEGRLFETVRDYDAQGLDSQWGRVWR